MGLTNPYAVREVHWQLQASHLHTLQKERFYTACATDEVDNARSEHAPHRNELSKEAIAQLRE